VVSEAPNDLAHSVDESAEFVVIGKAPGSVAVVQALEVVAVEYTCISLGFGQVARLADHLPW
jgi:hypothetical protein